jgi:hypothetical protein
VLAMLEAIRRGLTRRSRDERVGAYRFSGIGGKTLI